MLRRARAWASAEISRLVHAEVTDARAELDTSLQARVTGLAGEMQREAHAREQSIAASLDRVASSLDAIAEQLADQARDHRATLAAVEFIVREMAIAFVQPVSAAPSTVLGGTIEPSAIDLTLDPFASAEVLPRDGMGAQPIEAAASDAGDAAAGADGDDRLVDLPVGCIVEVRSRFQNRWVDGFEIVEVLDNDGAPRYRLARHADHVRLPALFDAGDLRPLDVVSDIVIEPDLVDRDDLGTDAADRSVPLSARDDPGSRR